ncbi:MAG: arsenite methyltransferase [Candidatus Methanofastidiosia archaeon]|jgi:SAM-dependent methyltransferase
MKDENVKKVVRKAYARVAKGGCCGEVSESKKSKKSEGCCQQMSVDEMSKKIGYTLEELAEVPEGSNLGLGCGNPIALASIKKGDTVLDLGSGAGFDCFLAANRVGTSGNVIGVDMTPDMLDKAREIAKQNQYDNVEFRLGEIENLPAGNNSVDVVISNCVINLSPDKEKVFQEAFRVLTPGGRLIVSDIVLLEELPESIRNSDKLYTGCVSGAVLKEEYIGLIKKAGFVNVTIQKETQFPVEVVVDDHEAIDAIEKQGIPIEDVKKVVASVQSISVQGEKPQ